MRTMMLLAVLTLAGCGGGAETPPPATAATAGSGSAPKNSPSTFAEQASAGQKLYAEKCASCHGAGGEGGKAPRVVGVDKGALPLDPATTAKFRKGQFRTAADVSGFVVKAMPPGGDPSLKEEDFWA